LELQDYHSTLEHVPRKTHTAADALLRPPGSNEGKQDNQKITMLPEATFIQIADADLNGSIETMITDCQTQYTSMMKEWELMYSIESLGLSQMPFWKNISRKHLVIPPNDSLK